MGGVQARSEDKGGRYGHGSYMGPRVQTRVFTSFGNVRGWHQRERYQEVGTENEYGDPNLMKAHCGVLQDGTAGIPGVVGPEFRMSRWRDEFGDLVLMKVTEETQIEVEYLAKKCKVQWEL
jgi:hypothetical protein